MSLAAFALPLRATAASLVLPPGPPASKPLPDGTTPLEAREGRAFLRGDAQASTPVWGYDGAVPGPTLRIKRGADLAVRLVNRLAEPTLLHWHGVRVPAAVEGVPFLTGEPATPGGARESRFAPPDAGTFWYHAHPIFPHQRERGLYGALVVEESEPVAVDQDVLLLIDAWRLNPDATRADPGSTAAPGEQVLTANGGPALDIAVRTNQRLRLRLVNAAMTRLFAVRIEGHRPVVMAIDGQPAEPFAARDARVALAPGNRVDLFLDATQEPGSTGAVTIETQAGPVTVARLVYAAEPPVRSSPLPAPGPLPSNGLPERMDLAKALRVSVPIGAPPPPPRKGSARAPAPSTPPGAGRPAADWRDPLQAKAIPPLFTIARGRAVVLALANDTAEPQLFELHNQPFRLLDALDDGWKPFWLDTFPIQPGQTARIAFVPASAGKRMLHLRPMGQSDGATFFWYDVA